MISIPETFVFDRRLRWRLQAARRWTLEAALPDIARPTATVCFGIADATSTATTDKIPCREVGH
jgi:hypothetical protein